MNGGSDMEKIGFIGLGSMGGNMARNILKAGYELTVFDINTTAMNDLERVGAEKADSAKKLGENSDIVFLMVQNFLQCEGCLLGENGLLQGMDGGILIVSSTISPDDVKQIQKLCLEKSIEVVDCPVSGGTKGSMDGSLTLMVGANETTYSTCLPLLRSVGTNIIKVGDEVGLGQTMKAVNQHLVSIHLVAMAEALILGVKSGLDLDMVYSLVKNSAGNSWIFEDKVPGILDRDFSCRSSLDIQKKDLNISCDIGDRTKSPLLLGSICKELFKMAEAKNLGMEDSSSIVKIYEELADVVISQGHSN